MKIGLVVCLCLLLFAGPAQSMNAPINVTAQLAHSHSLALGRPGRAGDSLLEQWRLHDRYGHLIGEKLLSCRWVTARQRYCAGVLRLPLGTLTFQGSSPTRVAGTYAITGGTGFYHATGGEMRFALIGLRKEVLYLTILR